MITFPVDSNFAGWLTLDQISTVSGIAPETILAWIKKGTLYASTDSQGIVRIHPRVWQAYLSGKCRSEQRTIAGSTGWESLLALLKGQGIPMPNDADDPELIPDAVDEQEATQEPKDWKGKGQRWWGLKSIDATRKGTIGALGYLYLRDQHPRQVHISEITQALKDAYPDLLHSRSPKTDDRNTVYTCLRRVKEVKWHHRGMFSCPWGKESELPLNIIDILMGR